MNRWLCLTLSVGIAGAAQAQGVVEKPAPSRFYGTARPPGVQQPAPVVPPQVAPPPAAVQRPPGQGAGARPGDGGPPPHYVQPVHSPRPIYVQPARRPHVDVVIGAPWPRPYYYGPRYGYPAYGYPGYGWGYPYPSVVVPPPVIYSPPAPTVYIERAPEPGPAATEQPLAGYWYWCADPQGWYPNVGECPVGWQPVPPRAAQ